MSNLAKRVLISIIGVPLLLAILIYGGLPFLIFMIIVSSIALWEFYSMFTKTGNKPLKIPMIIMSVLLITFSWLLFKDIKLIVLIVSFGISVFAHMTARGDRNPMNIAVDMLGLIYIALPLSMLTDLSNYNGTYVVLIIFILIWTCDSFAYFGGKLFGKRKLTTISPGKTMEGSLIGFFSTILVAVLLHYLFERNIALHDALALGIITGIMTQAGDLFESMIKRYCGVKDSSQLIPGHGGVLDRFDGLMLVVPFVYIYMNHLRTVLF